MMRRNADLKARLRRISSSERIHETRMMRMMLGSRAERGIVVIVVVVMVEVGVGEMVMGIAAAAAGGEVAAAVGEEGREAVVVLRVLRVERVEGTGSGQRTVVGIVVAHWRGRVVGAV